jgi:hypothetical protein
MVRVPKILGISLVMVTFMLHSSAGLLTQSLIPFESLSFISPQLKQGTSDTVSSLLVTTRG